MLGDAEPGNSESWLLARCFNDFLLPAGVRGVVSFADPVCRRAVDGSVVAPGHVGWIYQAMAGSLYTGRGTARTLLLLPDGRTLHPRTESISCGAGPERQLVHAVNAPPDQVRVRPGHWGSLLRVRPDRLLAPSRATPPVGGIA